MFIEQLTDEQKKRIVDDVLAFYLLNNEIKNIQYEQVKDTLYIKVARKNLYNNFTIALQDFSSKVILPTIWCGRYQKSTKYNADYIKYMEEQFREQNYKKEFVKYHTERIQQRADKEISSLEKIFE